MLKFRTIFGVGYGLISSAFANVLFSFFFFFFGGGGVLINSSVGLDMIILTTLLIIYWMLLDHIQSYACTENNMCLIGFQLKDSAGGF
jgi:hypothetical protein